MHASNAASLRIRRVRAASARIRPHQLKPIPRTTRSRILWEPPAEYALCRLCHRDRLHKRFLKPDIWAAHKAHVRRGGYASDVRRPEIVRELDAFRKAWRNGETFELSQLRPRIVPADAWWERLTTDPSSLTSVASRPRP